ncbi:Folate receptor gamma [Thelohanellus kitauei]|uniref:Folate receptor gamma n=1 Tax=Thelohanellus kitauei TaxID=669202 RepID=A0A0C2MP69_THEKT|nr:Folate receptor gamma [Thelohanellus kitauei]
MFQILALTVQAKHKMRCLKTGHHKVVHSPENVDDMGLCKPWSENSCCSAEAAKFISNPGDYYIHNVLFNQCPSHGNLSDECKLYFMLDSCFYHCGSIFLPWTTQFSYNNSITEVLRGIPLCSSDCDSWYDACKNDYTCSTTWYSNSFGTVNGTPVCQMECKRFKDYHPNSKQFCESIFQGMFKYSNGGDRCCMKLKYESIDDNLKCAHIYSEDYSITYGKMTKCTFAMFLFAVVAIFILALISNFLILLCL